MNYKIISTSKFEGKIKKFYKKYRSIKNDMELLVEQIKDDPHQGIYLGKYFNKDIYKIRLAIESKNRGKSGGARVFLYCF